MRARLYPPEMNGAGYWEPQTLIVDVVGGAKLRVQETHNASVEENFWKAMTVLVNDDLFSIPVYDVLSGKTEVWRRPAPKTPEAFLKYAEDRIRKIVDESGVPPKDKRELHKILDKHFQEGSA